MPGALEIPTAIAIALDAAQRRRRPYDGVVALGCVIRGETIHFEIVSQLSARGLMELSVGAHHSDRQRHRHRRQRGAGLGPRPRRRAGQRRRCRARRAGADRLKRKLGEALTWRSGANEARKANKRGAARLAAVQALYQMDLAGTGLNDIMAEFENHWLGGEVEGVQYRPAEAAYFRDIVGGVVREQSRLDPQIDAALASAAGRSSASRPCCARCCAPAPTNWPAAPTCRRAS